MTQKREERITGVHPAEVCEEMRTCAQGRGWPYKPFKHVEVMNELAGGDFYFPFYS